MKKFLLLLLLCTVIISSVIGFTACDLLENKSHSREYSNLQSGTGNNDDNMVYETAEEKTTSDEYFKFIYLEETDSYSIKAKDKNNIPEKIVLPAEHDGKKVTHIASYGFFEYPSLASITIPDSIISIGDRSFEDCSGLTSITIPDSVTSIGDSAFYHCDSLANITIPDSVTSIGDSAFYHCDNLQFKEYENGLYLGNENNPYVILVRAKSIDISFCTINERIKFIHSSAFAVCTSLTSFTIPNSVTSIGTSTFNGCTSLSSITIPDSVTSIGWCAFAGCSSLTSVTIPDSVTSIKSFAFSDCSSLTSVTIGKKVTSIADDAFFHDPIAEIYNKSALNIIAGNSGFGDVAQCAKAVYTENYTSKLKTDENRYVIYDNAVLICYIGNDTELLPLLRCYHKTHIHLFR